jgi:hypothetical protein
VNLKERLYGCARQPGMYSDGGGLYLQVARGGSRSWIFRYRFKGNASKAGKPLVRLLTH